MEKRKHDLEYPLQNLKSINGGLCRYCAFQVTVTNENDVKQLQNHYLVVHPVRKVEGEIPAKSTLKQRRNSNFGKKSRPHANFKRFCIDINL